MRLTLGPVLFNWPLAMWRDFYFRIADEAPVETVVVGEVVCSKRTPFFAEAMPEVVDRLRRAGKEVLLASLALVTLERERRGIAALATSDDFMVEANDVSCLAMLAGRPHTIGPLIQVYNEETARYLAGRGAARVCLAPELPATAIGRIAAAVPGTVVEVLGFGRAPLAISVRCYHARAEGLSKDNCRFVCERDLDGLAVETLDREPFVAVNGLQTLSHACVDLVGETHRLSSIGVGALRLSPQSCDMVVVASLFRGVLDGEIAPPEALVALRRAFPQAPHANGFLYGRPGKEWVAKAPEPSAQSAAS
jgi:collagenase-like PrtC family protease